MYKYFYVIDCEYIYYIDCYYSDNSNLNKNQINMIKENIIKDDKVLKYKPNNFISFEYNYESRNININDYIKMKMKYYGIDYVRGGDYSDSEFSDKIINKLNFEFMGSCLIFKCRSEYSEYTELSKKNINQLACKSEIEGFLQYYCFHCMQCHDNIDIKCLGKNIDTSSFLQDCNDYNTVIIKINYITNYYDKIILLKYQINDIIITINADKEHSKLDEKYKKYIMNNNDPDNLSALKDDIIKKYELESLLFDKKLELVNIYKIHKSEYYLKDILEELYKRKLKYMYDSIE